MKNKKQKVVSKIICAALAFFVFTLNSGLAQVAYAAPVIKPPVTAPTPPVKEPPMDCKGWTLIKETSKCFKDLTQAEKDNDTVKCPTSDFILDKNESFVPGGTGLRMVCRQRAKSGASPSDIIDITEKVQVMLGIQHFLNQLIWPVLILIGGLMENDLLFGNGMEEKLRDIWIPMRNLVNILFVIVLVGLALYNVLGLAEDNTSIKSMLPKIIIGIVAVNFSFVAIKVMLDGINVLTTAVFTLPGNISEELSKIDSDDALVKRFCVATNGDDPSNVEGISDDKAKQDQELKTYRTVADAPAYAEAKVAPDDSILTIRSKIKKAFSTEKSTEIYDDFERRVAVAQENSLCSGKQLTPQGKIFLQRYNSRNAAFALALNMGKIVFYQDVKVDQTLANGVESFFTNALFSLVLYLVYVASFIALFAVLLGRLVVMWLSIAVSPILLLMIASPTLKEKMGGLSKLSEQFTKNAIAPLLIALSLTVGWIMLRAIQGMDLGKKAGGLITSSLGINMGNGVPVASLSTLQDFVVALGVIAVVWLGVFSAAEGTVAEFATNFIKEKLTTAGKWVGSLPFKHMPIIPIQLPGHPHNTYTVSSVGHYVDRLSDTHESDQKLWNDLSGQKDVKAEDIHNVTDQAGLLSHLRGMKTARVLGNETYREQLRDWARDPGNKSIISALPDPLKNAVAVLANPAIKTDDPRFDPAIKEIQANTLVSGAAAPTTSATPAGPAAPVAPEAAPAVDEKAPFNGKPLTETLKTPAQRTALAKTSTELTAAITANDKTLIKTKLTEIGQAFTGTDVAGNLTKANLESLIGEAQVTALEAALPDEKNASGELTKSSLKQITEALNTPAATP